MIWTAYAPGTVWLSKVAKSNETTDSNINVKSPNRDEAEALFIDDDGEGKAETELQLK